MYTRKFCNGREHGRFWWRAYAAVLETDMLDSRLSSIRACPPIASITSARGPASSHLSSGRDPWWSRASRMPGEISRRSCRHRVCPDAAARCAGVLPRRAVRPSSSFGSCKCRTWSAPRLGGPAPAEKREGGGGRGRAVVVVSRHRAVGAYIYDKVQPLPRSQVCGRVAMNIRRVHAACVHRHQY